jgi:putative membrane protein
MRSLTFFAALALASAASVSTVDGNFAIKAAQAGMAEVKLGKLAQDNASSQAVKDFGAQMVKDHTDAGNELKGIASGKGLNLPGGPNGNQEVTYNRLSKLSGTQFDRGFANAMVQDHEAAVTDFRREASSGKDADLKSFASKTLPTLQHHLEMAKDLQKQAGATSAQ